MLGKRLLDRVTAPPVHDGTSYELGTIYPWVHEPPALPRGVLIGNDIYGGQFGFDPLEAARLGLVSSTNVSIFGVIGRAKSSLPKCWVFRSSVFGWRCWVLDPKGEYAAVARALGYEPIVLQPHGEVRFNPLDRQLLGDVSAEKVVSKQVQLLEALIQAGLGRELQPTERASVQLAVLAATHEVDRNRQREVSPKEPTLNLVAKHLLFPATDAGVGMNLRQRELERAGRDAGLTLQRLCEGDLRGMFDGETSGVRLDQPVVVIDLAAVYQSGSLGLIMTCLVAWLQRSLEARAGRTPTTIILDEAWAVLRNVHIARWVTSAIKLSRMYSASYWLISHKLSDFGAVGDVGSEQVQLGKALLEDIEMRIIYAQSPGEIEKNGQALGLNETERATIPQLMRGRAVWKIGQRSILVQHQRSRAEVKLTDTSSALHTKTENTEAVADSKSWGEALAGVAPEALREDAGGGRALAEARAEGFAEAPVVSDEQTEAEAARP